MWAETGIHGNSSCWSDPGYHSAQGISARASTRRFPGSAGDLPAEIRRHLLSTLEYDGLKALVHASPFYHQQYLLDRQHLLCQCFEITLGKNIVDACAVYQSELEFSKTWVKEKVPQFLESYQNRRSLSQYPLLKTIALDEDISIVTLHFSIIKPLAHYYASWALGNLAEKTKDLQSLMPLSKTEETRLVRALYRFQLWCNVFGDGPYRFYPRRKLPIRPLEVLKMFIDIYEPWEVEGVVCIHTFTKEMFNKVFDDIYWDVHQDNPIFEDKERPPTPEGAFDLDASRTGFLEGTLSRGLELLRNVLLKIKDHTTLVVTMQEQISRGLSLDNVLELSSMRRKGYPSYRDLKEKRRDPFPFQGDNGELPPLTWTLIWKGTYSNWFGWKMRKELDSRFWGYIMWDAMRLERTGAKEVLVRQLEACWGDRDPRDRL